MKIPRSRSLVPATVVTLAIVALAGGCQVLIGLPSVDLEVADGGTGAQTTTGSSTSSVSSSTGMPVICTPGSTMACYDGPKGTEGTGQCIGGTATCNAKGTEYGTCVGEVTPQPPTCATTTDVACIGHDNCVQWAELFGNLQGSYAEGVAVDAAGNAYVVGTFSGLIQLPSPQKNLTAVGVTDAFVLKLDPSGAPVWGASFGAPGVSTGGFTVAVDAAGDAVALGGTTDGAVGFGAGSAGPGVYAAKLNGAGGTVWGRGLTANYNSLTLNTISSVALTSSGDVVVGGHSGSDLDFGDGVLKGPTNTSVYYGFIGRLRGSDGSGSTANGGWGRVVCNGTVGCDVNGVAVAKGDDIVVAGSLQGDASLAPGVTMHAEGTKDAFIGNLTSDGQSVVWQRQIGGSGAVATSRSLAADVNGAPVLVGSFSGGIQFDLNVGEPTAASGFFVVSYTSDNAYRWNKILDQTVEGVAVDTSDNVILVGQFTGSLNLGGSGAPLESMGNANLFVAKLATDSTLVWDKQYGDGSSVPNAGGIAVTLQGDPIVVGDADAAITFGTASLNPVSQGDAFVVKLSP